MDNVEHDHKVDYFASMTDMVVGVLFIFIIMVAFFAYQAEEESIPLAIYESEVAKNLALQSEVRHLELTIEELLKQAKVDRPILEEYQRRVQSLEERVKALLDKEVVTQAQIDQYVKTIAQLKKELEVLKAQLKDLTTLDALVEYVSDGEKSLDNIVNDVIDDLRSQGIDAKSFQKGVVTISGKGLFANGSSDLSSVAGGEERVAKLAAAIVNRVRCFSFSTEFDVTKVSMDCNPQHVYLESVYVEGHTDNMPIGRMLSDGSRNNLELSARRATNTYQTFVKSQPALTTLVNAYDQQVLSVSAYGEQRPIASNSTAQGRDDNRRIDIRFVMYVPKSHYELNQFKARFM